MEKRKITEEDALTLLILTQQRKIVEHNAEVLTAEKAREITQAAILSIAEERIDTLTEIISEAAINGENSAELTFSPSISQEKVKALIVRYFVRLGYVVAVTANRTFHISW